MMNFKKTIRPMMMFQDFDKEVFVSEEMSDEEAIEFFQDLDDCPLCQELQAAGQEGLRLEKTH